MQENSSSELFMMSADKIINKSAQQHRFAEEGLEAAEADIDEVIGTVATPENERYRDSFDKISHNERAREVSELLDDLENDTPKIVEFMKDFLKTGHAFKEKHPDRWDVLKLFLIAHHELKQLQKKERENTIV